MVTLLSILAIVWIVNAYYKHITKNPPEHHEISEEEKARRKKRDEEILLFYSDN